MRGNTLLVEKTRAMKLWITIVNILLWPGRKLVRRFPDLGPAERNLLHNVTNYVVWLSLFCGLLIYVLIKTMPTA